MSITGPVFEEILFRGIIYDLLKKGFQSFYTFCSVPPNLADTLSKVSAIFFSAVIFGMAHFMNAYALNNPLMTVYPQVVYATVGGLIYGSLREYTQDIYLPIGLHIGNNVIAWKYGIISSLAKLVKSL
jgi:membrane protease YdiL (CAAX protease family)